ncbi:MAG: LysR family transcriptional regulator, partial [Rhodoferax sp.]|nr:LysR family transcriptional regulator [Rhodoferax sp.]
YDALFDETMLLYCGADHALFKARDTTMGWDALARYRFAGLGYHSPNMEITQQMRLARQATAFDQEAIATLILSGQFLGFLPDHYAAGFVRQRQMRALRPELFRYACQFLAIVRRSPEPSRAARVFQACLLRAHTGTDPQRQGADSYG